MDCGLKIRDMLYPCADGGKRSLETVKALDVGSKRQVEALRVGDDDDEDHKKPDQAALDTLANNGDYPGHGPAEKFDVGHDPEP